MKRFYFKYPLLFILSLSLSSQMYADKKRKSSTSLKTLQSEEKRTRLRNEILEEKIREVNLKLKLIKQQRILEKQVDKALFYPRRPYNANKKILTISDRQVKIYEGINNKTAERVIKEINFYNNKSKQPIFLMLRSPGGSVTAGFKILDAIKHSEAPVYVVAREYAASMAAIILALSERSFAMVNTRILHHEPSTFIYGNTSVLAEDLALMKEFERRLIGPLLEKFGYETIEDWRTDIYKHTRTGDWEEFGDRAHELGWVNNILVNIKDTSVRSLAPIEITEEPIIKL